MKRSALILFVATFFVVACQPRTQSEVIDLSSDTNIEQSQNNTLETGESMDYRGDINELKIEDIKVGSGTEVKAGDTVLVHYTGQTIDGKVFDSSKTRGEPIAFPIGVGQVIQGWDQGLIGMKEGGVRKLSIPPEMGYGARGAGAAIPPNASLLFEVELIQVN